jgi:hypothetical protein
MNQLNTSKAFEIDFAKTYEPIKKFFQVVHSDKTRIWSFIFSTCEPLLTLDFVFSCMTLIIIRRTTAIIERNLNFRMSALHKFACHFPVVVASALLLYYSIFKSLETSFLYTSFLIMFSVDLILSNMIGMIQDGLGRLERFRGEPVINLLTILAKCF